MKRWIITILIICLGIALTYIEVTAIRREKNAHLEEVVVARHSLERGHVLTEGDLKVVKTSGLDKGSKFTNSISSVVGKVIEHGLSADMVIYEDWLSQGENLLKKGRALTTLKMSPEEALCWQVKNGEHYEIGYVYETTYETIGPVQIVSVHDQQMGQSDVPLYLLIEGSLNDVQKIIKYRNLGRYELIKVGESH